MEKKIAFITGASRGIGAETAVALARIGYDVAITARTLADGEAHDHVGKKTALAGSLEATAAAVAREGREALCLKADILDQASVVAAAEKALAHFGQVDLLLNNAVYQGPGNQEEILALTDEQMRAIYQGNVFTPTALVQAILPNMAARGLGMVLNMASFSAFNNPPAAASKGGWSFAYPSSKAALARMASVIRVEHADTAIRAYNLEPGTVVTEVMRAAGIDENVLKRYKPSTPAEIAAVIAWLAENEPREDWPADDILRGPAMSKALGLLGTPSLLEA